MGALQVVVVSKNNRSEHLDSCTHWVEQPAVMFHGAGGDTVNYFHFWADSFSHVFNTIAELGYFDMGAFLARYVISSLEICICNHPGLPLLLLLHLCASTSSCKACRPARQWATCRLY